MRYFMIIPFIFSLLQAGQTEFNKLWYDGNAEISVYDVEEYRYGAPRKAERIMVFVTEPLDVETGIKPDTRGEDRKIVKALKLNDLLTFNTGIYKYNVMNSVFVGLENKFGLESGQTIKLSMSVQEWCGNVYERVLRKGDLYAGKLFSYFDSEGEKNYELENATEIIPEEALLINLRELDNEFVKLGESKDVQLLSSMWERRKKHIPIKVFSTKIYKKGGIKIKTAIGKKEANYFSWKRANSSLFELWVEKEYPHRILKWKNESSSKGEIRSSIRKPYWELNKNKDEKIRKSMGFLN